MKFIGYFIMLAIYFLGVVHIIQPSDQGFEVYQGDIKVVYTCEPTTSGLPELAKKRAHKDGRITLFYEQQCRGA